MAPAHETYSPPIFKAVAFHCPHSDCGVYAAQEWEQQTFNNTYVANWLCRCTQCRTVSAWLGNGELIYPRTRHGASPNPDMPTDVRAVYDEAREVSAISRKSAAALLRLALQMLIDELEVGSGSINSKIGALVDKGLPVEIQQAMDALRVIGNESVHPGQIDLDGADSEVVDTLFALLNVIVEDRVSKPKAVRQMYALIPPDKLKGIEDRDKPKD